MNSLGYALLDLAEVLRLAGRGEDAAISVREAIGVFERKGNVIAAAKARSLLEAAEVSVP